MKKIFIAFTLIFLTASFSNQLLAQTKTCTPEQIAACKKVCGDKVATNCTLVQKAACQKVCNNSSEAKVASYDGFKIPAITAVNATTKTAACQKKMAACSPASSVKLTQNKKASCTKTNTKIANNEEKSTDIIAQKVILETSVSNN